MGISLCYFTVVRSVSLNFLLQSMNTSYLYLISVFVNGMSMVTKLDCHTIVLILLSPWIILGVTNT